MDWLATRWALADLAHAWDWLVERLGVIADVLAAGALFLVDLTSSAEAVFILPVAWLTVATIVLGYNIFAAPAPESST